MELLLVTSPKIQRATKNNKTTPIISGKKRRGDLAGAAKRGGADPVGDCGDRGGGTNDPLGILGGGGSILEVGGLPNVLEKTPVDWLGAPRVLGAPGTPGVPGARPLEVVGAPGAEALEAAEEPEAEGTLDLACWILDGGGSCELSSGVAAAEELEGEIDMQKEYTKFSQSSL